MGRKPARVYGEADHIHFLITLPFNNFMNSLKDHQRAAPPKRIHRQSEPGLSQEAVLLIPLVASYRAIRRRSRS